MATRHKQIVKMSMKREQLEAIEVGTVEYRFGNWMDAGRLASGARFLVLFRI